MRKKTLLKIAVVSIILGWKWTADCSPPPDPVRCAAGSSDCTVSNAYGAFPDRSKCRAAEVAYPASEGELLAAVANGMLRKMRMRVATRYSHSIPKMMCPRGDQGLVISTRDMDHVLGIDKMAMQMTVEAGATLRTVIDAAADAGLALRHCPYWDGMTVGGILATGAHGSSLFGAGSAVHEYVAELRLVVAALPEEGYARVVSLRRGDVDFEAARVSLGLLGVVSVVTLELEPIFKRSVTNVEMDDGDLETAMVLFGLQHEFGDVSWYPSQRKVVFRQDDRVPPLEPGNGVNDYLGFRAYYTLLLSVIRELEEAQEATESPKCATAAAQVAVFQALGTGLTNDGETFRGYPVVGFQHRIQSAGSCLASPENRLRTACPWDPRVNGEFFFQLGISIAVCNISTFMSDIKRLRDLRPASLCGLDLYDGILMRYVKASSAFLGKPSDAVDLDIAFFRPRKPDVPTLFLDVFQELEQIAAFKYAGIPHWGKNRNIAFKGALRKFRKGAEFLKVKEKYDPEGFFANEWTDALFADRVEVFRNGCAIEGLCVCSEDRHCAPHLGYFCRRGVVYADARVCRRN